MQQTKARKSTPSPATGDKELEKAVGSNDSHSKVFVGMVLDMSWRLAIVVIVPIVGGFKLDEKLGTTPGLTITGFILAMVGFSLVCWQTLQAANSVPMPKTSKGRKA
jgi:hypothetical protein